MNGSVLSVAPVSGDGIGIGCPSTSDEFTSAFSYYLGAGKSTLAISFFRFVEATSGRIIIDNVDISQIGLHDLRSHLTIIPQDPILFNGTIRSNLDPFNRHADDAVWNALRRSHLIGDDEYRPPGLESLDATVSENGSNFSQGQRQLLALARALLRTNKVRSWLDYDVTILPYLTSPLTV